jgi:hypothetical protein
MTRGQCCDCPPGTTRSVSRPGPRCATHQRAKKRAGKDRAWELRILATYGITAEDYWAIYEAQGGKCWICKRATGASRRLSVDHDHKLGSGRTSVRGLLCRPCNTFLGHVRDDPQAGNRLIGYLVDPPARRVLRLRDQEAREQR